MARSYRLQVPLKPETRKAVEEYADALGVSPAAAASNLLEEAAPALVELTSALKSVQGSPARALRHAAGALHKATEKADQMLMELEPQKGKKRA